MNSRSADEFTLDGGHLPVAAEQIEARLHALWKGNMEGKLESQSAVRLCLANVLVIADAHSRPEAEQLAHDISHIHPSRIILVILDDDLTSYCAFVSTTCSRDPVTNSIRCWEIIEILSPEKRASDIPGAIRALMVGSVPVISIDFRAVQTTPAFDATVERLADYSFVNAQIVPSTVTDQHTMSLRWYRTLPIRELLSELFGSIGDDRKPRIPRKIKLLGSTSTDTLDELLLGWLMHRLGMRRPSVRLHPPLDLVFHGVPLSLEHDYQSALDEPILRIDLVGGAKAELRLTAAASGDWMFHLAAPGIKIERALSSYPLSRYIVQTFRSSSEFAEYERSCQLMATLDLSAR